MTDPDTTTDESVEGAVPRPTELTDKLDEIISTPAEGVGELSDSSVSTNPDNPREAAEDAVALHGDENKGPEPGETMGGGS
ncbi:MAG: hypothetical protein ACRDZW_02505 [Acidimicrobiales bacterium]